MINFLIPAHFFQYIRLNPSRPHSIPFRAPRAHEPHARQFESVHHGVVHMRRLMNFEPQRHVILAHLILAFLNKFHPIFALRRNQLQAQIALEILAILRVGEVQKQLFWDSFRDGLFAQNHLFRVLLVNRTGDFSLLAGQHLVDDLVDFGLERLLRGRN